MILRHTLSVGNLAIMGGTPLFHETLHVGRPNIGSQESFMARMADILERRWLSNHGPMVTEFERRLAEYLGARHCIAMCNATVALEITSRALGLSGEVIIPSFTFVATAHALQWQQITPVFADVDPQTHLVDPDAVEQMITPKTTGILGVHLWGRPCNVEALTDIASRHRLAVLFDASHAFGASHRGTMIGNFGDAEVFSFHATKFLNTFEGGAVVTNNDRLAEKIRLMKNFGFSGYDNVIYIGTNGKMNEVSAAMGLTGLESIEEFIEANYRNYREYIRGLSGVPGIRMVHYNEREKNNYQYIVAELDEHTTGISRDDVLSVLHAERVLARRYFYPGCHKMEPYRSFFPHAGLLLPHTEALARRVLSLPTGGSVTEETVSTVCELISFIVDRGREITARLKSPGAGFPRLHLGTAMSEETALEASA